MKRTKLRLVKETIRDLAPGELAQINGRGSATARETILASV